MIIALAAQLMMKTRPMLMKNNMMGKTPKSSPLSWMRLRSVPAEALTWVRRYASSLLGNTTLMGLTAVIRVMMLD